MKKAILIIILFFLLSSSICLATASQSFVKPALSSSLDWTGDTNWITTWANGQTVDGDSIHKVVAPVASARLTKANCPANKTLDITRKDFTPVNIGDTNGVLHVRLFHSFPAAIGTGWRGGFYLGSGTSSFWYGLHYLAGMVCIGDGQDATGTRISVGTGWDEVSIPLNSMGNISFDATDVSKFMFTIAADTHADMLPTNYICIDEIWVTKKIPTPAVIIMCDDAFASIATPVNGVTPLQAAAARGIKLVIAVVPEMIDVAGYMTTAQLADAVAMGHQLILHSVTQLSTHSYDYQYDYMVQHQALLQSWASTNGISIGDGYLHYVYHGNLADSCSTLAAREVFKTAWPCLEYPVKLWGVYSISGGCLPADPHRLVRTPAEGYLLTVVKAALDSALSKNNYACFYVHNITAAGSGAGDKLDKFDNWVAFLDYINTKDYASWTCDDIANLLEVVSATRCATFKDLKEMAENWLSEVDVGSHGDWNGNGKVNFLDFAMLADNWFLEECP